MTLPSFSSEESSGELPPDVTDLLAECEGLRMAGRIEDALCLLNDLRLADCADLLAMQAALLGDLGRLEEALAALRQARCVDDAHQAARFGMCFTLYLLERWPETLTELDALVLDAPNHGEALWLRAGLLRRLHGDHDPRVLDAYDATLCADPSNLYARLERADILRSLGRYQEAHAVYAAFLLPDACPDEALRVEAAFKSGCVSLVLGDKDTAHSAFQSVVDTAPNYPDAREMLNLTII